MTDQRRHPTLRQLTDQIKGNEVRGLQWPQFRLGSVIATDTVSVPVTATIQLSGDTDADSSVAGVVCMAPYFPAVGDTVFILQNGSDLVIIGGLTPRAPTTQVFNSGSGNWSKPAGCKSIRVRLVGGGGGGGGAPITGAGEVSVGSGGQGGGYAESTLIASTLPATIAYAVGAGGGGNAGADGSTGGTSRFGSAGSEYVSAQGGGGGVATTASSGNTGVGGGDDAETMIGQITSHGQAGGGAFHGAGTGLISGNGGSSVLGGGGVGRGTSGSGIAARGEGGGGGGAGRSASAAGSVSGGAGKNGIIIVEEFYF